MGKPFLFVNSLHIETILLISTKNTASQLDTSRGLHPGRWRGDVLDCRGVHRTPAGDQSSPLHLLGIDFYIILGAVALFSNSPVLYVRDCILTVNDLFYGIACFPKGIYQSVFLEQMCKTHCIEHGIAAF